MKKPYKKESIPLTESFAENDKRSLINTRTTSYSDLISGALEFNSGSKNGLSYNLNMYLEKSRENNPSYVCTNMNSARTIEFDPASNTEEVIFTFGLGGCVASALVVELADGSTKTIMTHYDPINANRGSIDISMFLNNLKNKGIIKSKLFMVAPGEWSKNDEGKWVMKTKDRYVSFINSYSESINSILGSNIDYMELPYSEVQSIGSDDQGTFRVVKNQRGEVRYIMENYYPHGLVFES